jgi:hypothetical protein
VSLLRVTEGSNFTFNAFGSFTCEYKRCLQCYLYYTVADIPVIILAVLRVTQGGSFRCKAG